MKHQQPPLLDVDPTARREGDFYETPAWMTMALVERVGISGRVMEPCAGRGAISNLLARHVGNIGAVAVNEPFPQPDCQLDASRLDATKQGSWDMWPVWEWVVTNPPFNLADQIVPLALNHARFGVAMLLRLSWLEPTEARSAFLKAHAPDRLIVLPRHDFRGNGSTDSVTSAWFVWYGVSLAPIREIAIVTRDERDELIAKYGKAA